MFRISFFIAASLWFGFANPTVAANIEHQPLLEMLRSHFNDAFTSSFVSLGTPSLPKGKSNVACVGRKSHARLPSRLSIARVFGDDMVLQAHQPLRIWGTAKPLTRVIVKFLGQTGAVNSDQGGNWMVEFPPIEKYISKGQAIDVSSGTQAIKLNNILVGEVSFCAGQSNMEWELSKTTNGAEAIAAANDDQLRLLNFPGKARGSSGAYNAAQFAALDPNNYSSGSWNVASPESARSFSGVGYYFAKKLRGELDCPVGMINVAVGGTPIESWVSADALSGHPTLNKMLNGNWIENPELGHPSDVHPKNKRPVGERLAAWALVNIYGRKGVAMGPLPTNKISFNGEHAIIEFEHVGEGLKTINGNPPIHFELAGSDKVFHSASARIVGRNQIKASSEKVTSPEFVRYAWAPSPEPPVNLVNSANFPASPFSNVD